MALLATVAIDPPAIAGAAAVFTLFASRSIAQAAARGLGRADARRQAVYGALIGAWFWICFAYAAAVQPAWMLVYWIDPATVPTPLWYGAFLIVVLASGAAGAYVVQRFLAAGNKRGAAIFTAGCFGLWLLLFALTFSRYMVVGTYAEFQAGQARPLKDLPAMLSMFNLLGAMTAVGLIAALVVRLVHERRLAREGTASAPAAAAHG